MLRASHNIQLSLPAMRVHQQDRSAASADRSDNERCYGSWHCSHDRWILRPPCQYQRSTWLYRSGSDQEKNHQWSPHSSESWTLKAREWAISWRIAIRYMDNNQGTGWTRWRGYRYRLWWLEQLDVLTHSIPEFLQNRYEPMWLSPKFLSYLTGPWIIFQLIRYIIDIPCFCTISWLAFVRNHSLLLCFEPHVWSPYSQNLLDLDFSMLKVLRSFMGVQFAHRTRAVCHKSAVLKRLLQCGAEVLLSPAVPSFSFGLSLFLFSVFVVTHPPIMYSLSIKSLHTMTHLWPCLCSSDEV